MSNNTQQAVISWEDFWERFDGHHRVLREEANDSVCRLESVLSLNRELRVLDFGCGYGFVARALAPKVGELYLWDASASMRRRALSNVADHLNIRFLDLSRPGAASSDMRFDLIFVNSVIQYMTSEQLTLWLPLWQRMLAAPGILVLSDLIPRGHEFNWDFVDLLRFAMSRRIWLDMVSYGFREMGTYTKVKRKHPLLCLNQNDLSDHARKLELEMKLLPTNLTYRTKRFSVMLCRD